MKLVSTVDVKMRFVKGELGLQEPLEVQAKAGEPFEMPDNMAEMYLKTHKHFSKAEDSTTEANPGTEELKGKFFTREELEERTIEELFEIAKELGFKPHPKTGREKLITIILTVEE